MQGPQTTLKRRRGGDVKSVSITVPETAQNQAVLGLGHGHNVEADQFPLQQLQERLGTQVAVERD
jgi:hypothetical protein